jgi:hypothetical protein
MQDRREECTEPSDGADQQQRRHGAESDEPPHVPPEAPGEREASENGHRHRVDRRDERPESRVDHARGEKELERIGRQVKQVQQERHGGVHAAKEREDPRAEQLRVVRHRQRSVREPRNEGNEAQREQLARVWKIERDGHDDVGQPARLRIEVAPLAQQVLASLDEPRQHDEEVARDERHNEGVSRAGEQAPDRNAGEHRNETRQHPQRDDERNRHVREEVHLDALELLDRQGTRSDRGHGEHPVWAESHDAAGGARDDHTGGLEDFEQGRLSLHADERHAHDHREEHDCGHDVVGQRVEGIRRDVEVDEVERRRPIDERRAEEGGVLDWWKGERE